MSTALDVISSALRLINVLAAGETADTATANDSLAVFQDMVDSWNAERLTIFTTSSADYQLVSNKQSYTLGTGGDFDAPRPARIDSMSAILNTNPANPIEEPIQMYSVQDWQTKVPVKNVSGSFPLICYDDGGYPKRTLNFWPISSDGANYKVRIYSWQALAAPASLTTAIAFPPGYVEAFHYNLAVRLAAEFAAQLPSTVAGLANEALARIRTMNAPDLELCSDLVLSPAGYNWRAEMFGIPY